MRSPRPRLLRTPASIQPASARASYRGGGVARVVGALGATAVLAVNLAGQAPSPPPGPDVPGSQPGITCPVGAVDIWPGNSIQNVVNLHPAGTTFCLRAGVHSLDRSITPRTGDTYVGRIRRDPRRHRLDDEPMTRRRAFRAYNEDIDYVTIRNLVIRNMPQYGIHAFHRMADHWTIEYNEIASNKWGLLFGPDFTIRNNYIHHNVGTTRYPLIRPSGAAATWGVRPITRPSKATRSPITARNRRW